jgi:hypothetical protein
MNESLLIEADMLATGQTQVEIKIPKYKDLRKSRRLFPYDRPDRDRLGYLPEDLFLASLLISVNGKAVDPNSDLIDRLGVLPLTDKQALAALVNETFYLSKEKANIAADNAKLQAASAYEFRTIPAEEMPSNTSIKFMMPNTSAQIACEQNYQGIEKSGAGLEEYMFAYCLIDNSHSDKLAALDDWDIEDVQYAVNYFIVCASIDEDTRVNIKKTSKALRQRLRGGATSNSLERKIASPAETARTSVEKLSVQERQTEDVADLQELMKAQKL